jgi:S-adenosylmethionine-dependent methyltransferase
MSADTQARFDAGAKAWAGYNQKPLGRIRREVTWKNLAPHLPAVAGADRAPRVLDAGGGSGELALRLLRHGCAVWLLDYAPAMLDQAQQAAQVLPEETRARLTLCPMAADDAPLAFEPSFFDAVACHTLLEYLPDPRSTLGALTSLLCDDGVLSLSFVNLHAEVLRQAWSRLDPAGALARLKDGAFCATLFDLPGTAYTAGEVGTWLEELGLTVTALCGVRVFADFVPRERLDDPEFLDTLLRLELVVATQAPYNLLARYVHLIAHKRVEH